MKRSSLHCLVLDGVYQRTDGEPVFAEVPAPTDEAPQEVRHQLGRERVPKHQ